MNQINDFTRAINMDQIPYEARVLGENNAYATAIATLLFLDPDFKMVVAAEVLYQLGITGDKLMNFFETCKKAY